MSLQSLEPEKFDASFFWQRTCGEFSGNFSRFALLPLLQWGKVHAAGNF
jgi:hypothetical protein